MFNNKKTANVVISTLTAKSYFINESGGVRTHDRSLRSRMLYPAELPTQTSLSIIIDENKSQ